MKIALKLLNMMRMDGAGLVENDVFAKTLRMLGDPYKCLKNVAIDCHPHCRILENGLRMLRTLKQMPLQIMRTPSANTLRMKQLRSECLSNCFHLSLIRKQYSKKYQCTCKSKSPAMPKNHIITGPILLLKHTPLCYFSQTAIYIIKKRQFYWANQIFTWGCARREISSLDMS